MTSIILIIAGALAALLSYRMGYEKGIHIGKTQGYAHIKITPHTNAKGVVEWKAWIYQRGSAGVQPKWVSNTHPYTRPETAVAGNMGTGFQVGRLNTLIEICIAEPKLENPPWWITHTTDVRSPFSGQDPIMGYARVQGGFYCEPQDLGKIYEILKK